VDLLHVDKAAHYIYRKSNMIVNFAKMHGLGNDFVVIDLITQGPRLKKNHLAKIADRKLGIGCDQVILVTPPSRSEADFRYKIYNSDGKEAEQCVNGLRCAAKFFSNMGLTNKTDLVGDCVGGSAQIKLHENNLVSTTFTESFSEVVTKDIDYPDLPKQIHTVSVGNPHAVLVVDKIDNHKVKTFGRKLSRDKMFPNGANIGFMEIKDRNKIKLRVYERGSGLTLACGSGACAAAIVGNELGLLDNEIAVHFRLGELRINVKEKQLTLTGPTSNIYIGRFKL